MANKGNVDKYKTAAYYRSLGYHVDYMESYRGGKKFQVKHDILGADGVSTSAAEFILWNSTDRTHVARAKHKFEQYPCPQFVKRVVVVWTLRCSTPDIIPV